MLGCNDGEGKKISPSCPEVQEEKKQNEGLVLLGSCPASFVVHVNTIFREGNIGNCAREGITLNFFSD